MRSYARLHRLVLQLLSVIGFMLATPPHAMAGEPYRQSRHGFIKKGNKDLTTVDLKSTLTQNQEIAYDLIKNGRAVVIARGDRAAQGNILRQVSLTINPQIKIAVNIRQTPASQAQYGRQSILHRTH